jgi:hypothetical protein
LHKILSNTTRNPPAPPPTTPNIIGHKTTKLLNEIVINMHKAHADARASCSTHQVCTIYWLAPITFWHGHSQASKGQMHWVAPLQVNTTGCCKPCRHDALWTHVQLVEQLNISYLLHSQWLSSRYRHEANAVLMTQSFTCVATATS